MVQTAGLHCNNIHVYQGEGFNTEAEEKQTWAVWKRLPSAQRKEISPAREAR